MSKAEVRRLYWVALIFTAILAPGASHAGVILGTVTAGGYIFTNFDPTLTSFGAVGSNANGINNNGQVVGTEVNVNNASTFANFTGTPGSTNPLNTGAGQIAFGINSAGDVVGGNGATAFFLPNGGSLQTLAVPSGALNAFGINDMGNIVGQYVTALGTMPGFYLVSSSSGTFIELDAPSGPDVVNAQGVNNNGLVVGFYLGTDGQVHGFDAQIQNAVGGQLTGTAIADPVITPVEPGATFVFSQILGINDNGLAVGYYGDSTTSQHGFFYNTKTGKYTFLDDPSEGFFNGVEVTQITGINNSGQISGFYTDTNGIAHSFLASPVPEPTSWLLTGIGWGALGWMRLRKRLSRQNYV
jgi:hypothetical protein